jgi:hypothetical protein
VPAENEFPVTVRGVYIQSCQMDRIGSLALHQRVFKRGRRSNQTTGFVNPVRATELMTYENRSSTITYKVSNSWAMMQKGQDGKVEGYYIFSKKGDSGSAVFSQDGQFVGLLRPGTRTRGISYVTAAQGLMEDIKQIAVPSNWP